MKSALLSLLVLVACTATASQAEHTSDALEPEFERLNKRIESLESGIRDSRAERWSAKYTGKCHNDSVDKDGDLTLLLSADGASLTGAIIINNGLYGTGHVQGRIDKDSLTLVSASFPYTVVWEGKLTATGIEGTYSIPDNPWSKVEKQAGKWSVQRAKTDG